MPDNVIGDVFEGLKQTAGKTLSQAVKAPLDILETGVNQVSGRQAGPSADEKNQQKQAQNSLNQYKISDAQNSQAQIAQIRQNLATMMQVPQSPKEELPKYISGKVGFDKEKLANQEEEAKKAKKKLPDLSELLKRKGEGSNERFRGVSG